jgi:hypothetical protein
MTDFVNANWQMSFVQLPGIFHTENLLFLGDFLESKNDSSKM